MRLGKQARDDGAKESDYVLGDMVEALIGAIYLDLGLIARAALSSAIGGRCSNPQTAPKHPKSALQEWSAAHKAARCRFMR
jgi:ribonuclease-3